MLSIKKLAAKWASLQLSSLEYLSQLNSLAGRTFHDPARHPIFPNVVKSFNCSKPESLDFGQAKQSHSLLSGTLDSSEEESTHGEPTIATFSLNRKHPYFFSLAHSVDGATFGSVLELKNQVNRIYELTPEYYTDPSFLLGNKQRDPVVLPKFSSDPYAFIVTQHKMLESPETSLWIPKWVDWVFGCDSRTAENAWGSTVESTIRNSSRELPDNLHLRLFQEPHLPRMRPEEHDRSNPSLLGKGKRFSIYQPSIEDFEGLTYFVHVCSNPRSDELALFSPSAVTVLSKKQSVSPEEAGQPSRGLSVVEESPLKAADMSKFCSPILCDWAKLRLIGVLKCSIGGLGFVDPGKDSFEELHIGSSAISALALDPGSRLLYVGTHDGLLQAYSLTKDHPSLVFSSILGALPAIDRVVCAQQVFSIDLLASESVLLLQQANNILTVVNSHTGDPVCSIKLPKRLHKVGPSHRRRF